ncbi:hypothetical protein CCC_02545 [Paramagnetospirillum magnetotacticum MS-1]|uniref:Response regulatory domain-containing protein n=1 Tax=Paramagnetospirillum magnetotacticum MS-1 TaxID=272627 RepID=A0A0C2YZF1_PARME|nr:hypothetical protein CCC_02545 [Paramagnetospirillum magnetotacticum MS-1]
MSVCEIELLIVASEIEGQSTLDVINLIRAGKARCKKKLPIVVLGSPSHDAEAFEAQPIYSGASAYVAMPLSMKKVTPRSTRRSRRMPTG